MVFKSGQPLKEEHFPSFSQQFENIKIADASVKSVETFMNKPAEERKKLLSQIDTSELPEGMEDDLNNLKRELFSSKIAEQDIYAQSVAAGGPSSAQGAIQNLMDYGKIGIRRLSVEVEVPRKKLQAMVEGRIDMPGEISNKIITFFEQKLPHLFQ